MSDDDKLIAALDMHQPMWRITFAQSEDLRDVLARRIDNNQLATRVLRRHTVFINAAIEAGLVELPKCK